MAHELLLACAWKATLVLAAAGALDGALRRSSAAARHAIWAMAFLAMLLLPALSAAVPRWTARAPALQPPAPARLAQIVGGAARPAPAGRDWMLTIWAAGAAVALARFGLGTARMWLLTRRSTPLSLGGCPGHVVALDAGRGAMPLAWGWLRPAILLPSESRDWPAEKLRATLLHELAHVERGDCWTLAMAEAVLGLYWFHPLAWWGSRRMRRERERACDDRVLAGGVSASGYARDLLSIACETSGKGAMAPAMAFASHLEVRLRAILDPKVCRRPMSARALGVTAGMALLALLPLAAVRLAAQNAVAGLSGVVYDVSGAAVPNATVAVAPAGEGHSQKVTSGADGSYSFPQLPAGVYQVMATHPGFAIDLRQSVKVPATLDFTLSLGQVRESLTVSGRGVAAAPAAAPRRIRVGGNVVAAKALEMPRPIYPAEAESAGLQGTVSLRAVITTSGGISGLSVISSPDPALSEAAMEAVRQWRYQPTLLNGQPVEVVTTISVSFRLNP